MDDVGPGECPFEGLLGAVHPVDGFAHALAEIVRCHNRRGRLILGVASLEEALDGTVVVSRRVRAPRRLNVVEMRRWLVPDKKVANRRIQWAKHFSEVVPWVLGVEVGHARHPINLHLPPRYQKARGCQGEAAWPWWDSHAIFHLSEARGSSIGPVALWDGAKGLSEGDRAKAVDALPAVAYPVSVKTEASGVDDDRYRRQVGMQRNDEATAKVRRTLAVNGVALDSMVSFNSRSKPLVRVVGIALVIITSFPARPDGDVAVRIPAEVTFDELFILLHLVWHWTHDFFLLHEPRIYLPGLNKVDEVLP